MKDLDFTAYFLHSLDQISLSLRLLMKASDQLGPVLDLEEKALSDHHISGLENALIEKKKVSETLNASMLQCREKIQACMKLLDPQNMYQEISLSRFSETLTQLPQNHKHRLSATLTEQDYSRITTISKEIDKLLERFIQNKLRTEKNRLITATLLKNHQESYQFWCELVREKNSQYNEKGSVSRPENISQITIEA